MGKNKFIYLCLIVVMLSSIVVAFKSLDTKKGLDVPTNVTKEDNRFFTFELNDMPVKIDFETRDTWYDMTSMTTEVDMNLKVPSNKEYKYEVNSKEIEPGAIIPIRLEELSKNSGIAIHITKRGSNDTHKYAIRSLHNGIPDFDVHSASPKDGFYYFNCEKFIIKMNTQGKIVYYKYTPGDALDFKRTEINGVTYYSYLEMVPNRTSNSSNAGYIPSSFVVMDDKYNIIDNIPSIALKDDSSNEISPLDTHDAIIIDKGHYIVISYVKEHVNNIPNDVPHNAQGVNVLAGVVQEIKDGKVIFQWKSTDYPELYRCSNFDNDYYNKSIYYADYLHLNSIEIDPKDNNLLLSLRNLDEIIKVDHDSGNILWTLGGAGDQFGLKSEQKTNKQHFARYTENGTITVFDNGLNDKDSEFGKGYYQSSVKEYKIDETTKKLESYNQFKIDGRYSPIMGSATRLDKEKNVFLIGWGGRKSCTSLFSEEDFDSNSTLFEAVYNKNLNDSFSSNSYRVYKDVK